MTPRIPARVVGWGVGLLLLGALATRASAQPLPISACGVYGGSTSYIVTADLTSTGDTCLTFTSNGTTVNLNGHSIRGAGINAGLTFTVGTASFNNNTITGPGIVHDFATCLDLRGNHNLVKDVLAYNCENWGIRLGDFSKCAQCRVHDVRASEGFGVGIQQGLACLLESSIVETSDVGVIVGADCKVWGLVVDTVVETGLKVGAGTSVARTVISHYHDGPGLDYTSCTAGPVGTAAGCQDSSNSVSVPLSASAPAIADTGALVITDGATNANGARYRPSGSPICPSCTFAFSRTVNTIQHMTNQVTFDKGCTATDPYGSNHCTWTLGEQVTEAHQGVLQEDITTGRLVVNLTLTDTIHGTTPFAFNCPICGGDCTIVNPFSAASETFAMPACPIQATTIPPTQTPFTVPRNLREAIPVAVPVVLRSTIEHVFGELGVPFGDLSVPSSVAGTVQIADQSGGVIFKVSIEAEWQP